VATPYYRATVPDPMGLCRRRRFLVEGRTLIDIFDEDLAHPGRLEAGAYVPDPLLAEVNRARTGEMRDIVATIQAEQDVIIRAPLERCIVVQGGPGTGKTAVGLHRAAFLLYEHRELLERQRLLIVGPNRISCATSRRSCPRSARPPRCSSPSTASPAPATGSGARTSQPLRG
jgi:DNA helicase IV